MSSAGGAARPRGRASSATTWAPGSPADACVTWRLTPRSERRLPISASDARPKAGEWERCGSAPDANALPIAKTVADLAMDAAACIGCGACAAACPNSSAMLFVSAKTGHLGLLPQGKAEKNSRILKMVRTMDKEGFGNCSNYYACEAVCPAAISATFIARLNREYTAASAKEAVGAVL